MKAEIRFVLESCSTLLSLAHRFSGETDSASVAKAVAADLERIATDYCGPGGFLRGTAIRTMEILDATQEESEADA